MHVRVKLDHYKNNVNNLQESRNNMVSLCIMRDSKDHNNRVHLVAHLALHKFFNHSIKYHTIDSTKEKSLCLSLFTKRTLVTIIKNIQNTPLCTHSLHLSIF